MFEHDKLLAEGEAFETLEGCFYQVQTRGRVEPRQVGGVDYGTEGWVIVRAVKSDGSERRLVWRPGHKSWNGVGQPWSDEPAALTVMGQATASESPGCYDDVERQNVLHRGRTSIGFFESTLVGIRDALNVRHLTPNHIHRCKRFQLTAHHFEGEVQWNAASAGYTYSKCGRFRVTAGATGTGTQLDVRMAGLGSDWRDLAHTTEWAPLSLRELAARFHREGRVN